MNAASAQSIKAALQQCDKKELIAFCLRLSRFKKENKELLSFLLFDEKDPAEFLLQAKAEIDELFLQVNTAHVFYAKKTIRKIVRMLNKYGRITSDDKSLSLEMIIRFLTNFQGLNMKWQKEKLLVNIYTAQFKKAQQLMNAMHEDLRYEYERQLERLSPSHVKNG